MNGTALIQITLTVVFYIWLFFIAGILLLLFIRMANTGTRLQKIFILLAESAQRASDAAQKNANAVELLVKFIESHDYNSK